MNNLSITSILETSNDSLRCPICATEEMCLDRRNDGVRISSAEGATQSIITFRCKNHHIWDIIIRECYGYNMRIFVQFPEFHYHDYIKSTDWRTRANNAKKKAGWCCQLCNQTGDKSTLHAHHRTYERLGNELPEDITVLCSDCHNRFHRENGLHGE